MRLFRAAPHGNIGHMMKIIALILAVLVILSMLLADFAAALPAGALLP